MSTVDAEVASHRLYGWTLIRSQRCDTPDCVVQTFAPPPDDDEYRHRWLAWSDTPLAGLTCRELPEGHAILLRIEHARRMAVLPMPRLRAVVGPDDDGSAA